MVGFSGKQYSVAFGSFKAHPGLGHREKTPWHHCGLDGPRISTIFYCCINVHNVDHFALLIRVPSKSKGLVLTLYQLSGVWVSLLQSVFYSLDKACAFLNAKFRFSNPRTIWTQACQNFWILHVPWTVKCLFFHRTKITSLTCERKNKKGDSPQPEQIKKPGHIIYFLWPSFAQKLNLNFLEAWILVWLASLSAWCDQYHHQQLCQQQWSMVHT